MACVSKKEQCIVWVVARSAVWGHVGDAVGSEKRTLGV